MADAPVNIRVWLAKPDWMDRGLCVGSDPDVFFPARGEDTVRAKAICRTCPVQAPCLDYAMLNAEKFGIWGGFSERERRRLRRRYRSAA